MSAPGKDGKSLEMIPGEVFEAMSANYESGPQAHALILDTLLDKCFKPEHAHMREPVLAAMPQMEARLLEHSNSTKSLKIALDVGNLGKMSREQDERLVYEAALIVMFYIHIHANKPHPFLPHGVQLYKNYEDLWSAYDPCVDFSRSAIDPLEQRQLVSFANLMKVTLLLIPQPKYKKAHLLDLISRVTEGKRAKYITGSGQTIATCRRVRVYQKESGVVPTPRPPRKIESGKVLAMATNSTACGTTVSSAVGANSVSSSKEVTGSGHSYSHSHSHSSHSKQQLKHAVTFPTSSTSTDTAYLALLNAIPVDQWLAMDAKCRNKTSKPRGLSTATSTAASCEDSASPTPPAAETTAAVAQVSHDHEMREASEILRSLATFMTTSLHHNEDTSDAEPVTNPVPNQSASDFTSYINIFTAVIKQEIECTRDASGAGMPELPPVMLLQDNRSLMDLCEQSTHIYDLPRAAIPDLKLEEANNLLAICEDEHQFHCEEDTIAEPITPKSCEYPLPLPLPLPHLGCDDHVPAPALGSVDSVLCLANSSSTSSLSSLNFASLTTTSSQDQEDRPQSLTHGSSQQSKKPRFSQNFNCNDNCHDLSAAWRISATAAAMSSLFTATTKVTTTAMSSSPTQDSHTIIPPPTPVPIASREDGEYWAHS